MVGQYISIEKAIADTKEMYYEVLQKSDQDWYVGKNDPKSFIKYMLGIILSCYREFESRIILTSKTGKKSNAYDIVKAFFVLFLVVDVMYLIKWHFMKEHLMKDICTFLFSICLFLDSVWLILAVIMWRQRNTEKYRDDVECDKTRKERLNLENIIVFAIFWAIVCALVSNLAVTTTKYMDKAQRENAQVAASELKMGDNTVELGNYEP